VASLVQVNQFGGDTRPTITEVATLIQRKEDEIDYVTGHAWRMRYSTSVKGTDTASPKFEYYDVPNVYDYSAGIPIRLNHRSVYNFSAASGDALQCWDGETYVDYLTDKTEGRGHDWWLDNDKGIIYIYDTSKYGLPQAVRVKYRYGETSIPGDIEEATMLLVAADLAMSDDRSYLFPKGGDSVVLSEKVQNWKKRAEEEIARHSEIT